METNTNLLMNKQQAYTIIKKTVNTLKKTLLETRLTVPYLSNLYMAAIDKEEPYNETAMAIKELLMTHKADISFYSENEPCIKIDNARRWTSIPIHDITWKAFQFPGQAIPIHDKWANMAFTFKNKLKRELGIKPITWN